MIYFAYHIQLEDVLQRELLIHQLGELNILGLEEFDRGVKVYVDSEDENGQRLEQYLVAKKMLFERTEVPDQNWNQLWESNFQPVYIENKIQVRASFHPPKAGYLFDILIDPKMSFGTGHHETTQMMMQSMLELDFTQKKVLDFGAGTGILSVLAEKLGARQILALDYDPWCIVSIEENIALNGCKFIEAYSSDRPPKQGSFDVILANINKNVLLEHAELLTTLSISSGFLVLSGLLSSDYEEISSIYSKLWKNEQAFRSINNWISIVYNKKRPL